MCRLTPAVPLRLLLFLLIAWGEGTCAIAEAATVPGEDSSADSPYYGYSTHPRAAEATGLVPAGEDATFIAPEVIGPDSSNLSEPIAPAGYDAGVPTAVPSTFAPSPRASLSSGDWHLLPGNVMYKSLIAGVHAPRMGAELVSDDAQGSLLDGSIGGRIPVLRRGTLGPNPEGWELQVYGAALSRLSMERQSDVEATDYAFGIPLVWRRGPTAVSFGYDHISSHIGDEYLIRNPDFERINYVRDSVELAVMQDLTEALAVYGEVNRTFHGSGGSEPWHFQFGAEYEPPVEPGWGGAPVAAVNTLLRQEFDYEGSLGIVAGWQWRGLASDDLLRLGLTLYTGHSRQFSFFDRYEKLFGIGIWYDF